MQTYAATELCEIGLTELVGVDEQVDQNDYSGSIEVNMGGSGEFLAFALISTGGDEIQAAGKLFLFDADPAVSSGDTALTAAEWKTLVGVVNVAASDYVADSGGAVAYITDTPVPFHDTDNLYFVFKLTSATSLNSAGGDNESLELNAWYRRDT